MFVGYAWVQLAKVQKPVILIWVVVINVYAQLFPQFLCEGTLKKNMNNIFHLITANCAQFIRLIPMQARQLLHGSLLWQQIQIEYLILLGQCSFHIQLKFIVVEGSLLTRSQQNLVEKNLVLLMSHIRVSLVVCAKKKDRSNFWRISAGMLKEIFLKFHLLLDLIFLIMSVDSSLFRGPVTCYQNQGSTYSPKYLVRILVYKPCYTMLAY